MATALGTLPLEIEHWQFSEAGHSFVHEMYGRTFDPQAVRSLRIGPVNALRPPDWLSSGTGRFGIVFAAPAGEGIAFSVARGVPEVHFSPNLLRREPLRVTGAAALTVALVAFNPTEARLERQLASLRAQTLTDWRCVILDAGSEPGPAALLRQAVQSDPRFQLLRVEDNDGAPRNFFRLLEALPRAGTIALCDQDDDWLPAKLARTKTALEQESAMLAYCDMRVVDESGRVLSPSFWLRRRNQWRDPVSLLLANTITGAASIIRGDLASFAAPLPRTRVKTYHDHWLGLCALALGRIAYVDAALYDYIQHGDQEIGHRVPRTPPLARDVLMMMAIGWKCAVGAINAEGLSLRRVALVQEALRVKHLALTLLGRAEARGAAEGIAELGRFAAFPRDPASRRWLWRRGLERFARHSDTIGAEWRMLLAAGSRL